ncbi:hypothetical protein [Burkholderia sp. MSMB1835]|uniref:hypothetical protein n=1 Tax=Burkholderia sp. MSMB1835 TaxID=1637876 RepID=UPI00211D7752|nr:hypothetical protein [Burkholderia sp. MSMB1835]
MNEHGRAQNETRASTTTHIDTQTHDRVLQDEKQVHTIALRRRFRQIRRTKKQSPVNTGLACRSVPLGT